MSRARIVTDSTAELPQEVIDQLAITVVPWRVQLGSETVIDGPNLRTAEFYHDIVKRRRNPVALAPTVQQFADAYARLAHETDTIISLHSADELTKAGQAARQARLTLLGRCDIHVMNAQFISRALGIIVEEAARAALKGMPGQEIVRVVNGIIPHTYLALYVETLDQLVRHGLIADSRERLGFTASYKPLLLLEGGRLEPLQRSRRRGEPGERIVEFISEFRMLRELVILHTGLTPGLQELTAQLTTALPEQPFHEHIYGPVLASLIGPVALGVVAFEG